MSLETPLGKVLGLGSAGDGPAHWWSQRVSAVALALLAIWFVVSLAGVDLGSHGAVTAWLTSPLNTALAVLLVAVTAYHSALGVQVVIEDYVGGGLRVVSMVLSQFLHIVLAGIGIVAILRVAFGDSA
jgi:succinate dehydrogenase / fumarate reductase membrane anchor subunit